MRMPVAQAVKKACILFGRFLSLAKGKPKNTVKPAKAPRATISAVDMLPSLVHLHLTFSGLVCILSLKERQEQCPFTTRLRVLKLDRVSTWKHKEKWCIFSYGNIWRELHVKYLDELRANNAT